MTARRIRNISFHGIGVPAEEREPGEHRYWVTVDSFLRVLDECVQRTGVRVSFDDGNASDVAIALPALVERGLTADFFPVAERIGTPGNVDQDGLRELAAAGMTVGSHGAVHQPWTTASDAELVRELETARAVIAEASGHEVDTAACPFGAYDRRVLRRLRKAGYRVVFTSDRRPAREGQWCQPRYSVRADDTPESLRSTVFAARGVNGAVRDAAVGTIKAWR
jgi:peptidoglycan/xylan/chitin deacetylase (PgdA/CDA1 family)